MGRRITQFLENSDIILELTKCDDFLTLFGDDITILFKSDPFSQFKIIVNFHPKLTSQNIVAKDMNKSLECKVETVNSGVYTFS